MLAGPPHRKEPHQIRRQWRWWTINVLCYPRNEKGELAIAPKDEPEEPMSQKDRYFADYRKHGFEDWQIKKMWERDQKWRNVG